MNIYERYDKLNQLYSNLIQTMSDINVHQGYKFTQPLISASQKLQNLNAGYNVKLEVEKYKAVLDVAETALTEKFYRSGFSLIDYEYNLREFIQSELNNETLLKLTKGTVCTKLK